MPYNSKNKKKPIPEATDSIYGMFEDGVAAVKKKVKEIVGDENSPGAFEGNRDAYNKAKKKP